MAGSLQLMNKRLVLLNPKFLNQKRVGTAPNGQRLPVIDGQMAPQAESQGEMGGQDMDYGQMQQMQ